MVVSYVAIGIEVIAFCDGAEGSEARFVALKILILSALISDRRLRVRLEWNRDKEERDIHQTASSHA